MLDQFREIVLTLNPQAPLDARSEAALTISYAAPLRVIYAPFEYTPNSAKIVLVGITPGKYQAEVALKALHFALKAGKPDIEALRIAKLAASFSGPMRKNLLKMLDLIGIPAKLGLVTAADLFDHTELAHFTSALRYPVFKKGENYSGTPNMLKTPGLRQMINTHLAEEVRALPNAVWMPLGEKPVVALRHLVASGVLAPDRLLEGLPHPSGANNGPIGRFMSANTDDVYGAAREHLRDRLTAISL